ncbi:AP-1 complex subunit mu-2 [Sesamum angolense]|uniref:AP-1 complex subunit mu-2 n=1 Tax=Sesamum angolense TaxID=2727404 RepID=A0AAE1WKC0_9LAMI|nr:AP-1 complex subunit mu-2 [Sesamum angolense]
MAGATSALYILDIKGRCLISRDYRGQVSAAQVEKFFSKLLEKEYELLDEIMDFGYPQYTEAKILSEFIKTDAYKMEGAQRPPMAVTNAVSWRSEGVVYRTNEVFLDVVESVNILVNSNGQIIRSEVYGALKMRTRLSGMPECKLGLNDRVLLEAQDRATKGKAIDLDDVKFHQCVRLARFENDRTISFIPPDGSFDLMTYRLSTQEYMLRAEFRLPSIVSEDAVADRKAPIRVKFEIPYFTVSGIQVRYLKIIEKSGYQALPWVRYITMAGDYELRLI